MRATDDRTHRGHLCAVLVVTVMFMALFLSVSDLISNAYGVTNDVNSNVTPVSGTGAADDPWVYDIGASATLSWPYLNEIGGFDDEGASTGETRSLLLNNLMNGDSGRTVYSWYFQGEGRSFITDELKGPYALSVALEPADDVDTMRMVLGTSREMYGPVTLTVDVQDYFSAGDELTVTYDGGDPSADYHGGGGADLPSSGTELGNCSVDSDCYLSIDLSYGGSYLFTRHSDEPDDPVDPGGNDDSSGDDPGGSSGGSGDGSGGPTAEDGSSSVSSNASAGTASADNTSSGAMLSTDSDTTYLADASQPTSSGSTSSGTSADSAVRALSASMTAMTVDDASDEVDQDAESVRRYLAPFAVFDVLGGFAAMLWLFRKELG